MRCRERHAPLRAGMFLTGFLNHVPRRRQIFQSFTDLFHDALRLSLVLRTLPFLLGRITNHPPPLRRLRQTLPTMPRALRLLHFSLLWRGLGSLPRGRASPLQTATTDFHWPVRASPHSASAAIAGVATRGIQSLEPSHHHRLQGSEVFQQAVLINLQRAAFSRPARPAPVPPPDLPTR